MTVQSFPQFAVAHKLPTPLSPQQNSPDPQPPEDQGDSFRSSLLVPAAGAGVGTVLGVYAGVSSGVLPGLAGTLVGTAGGALGGALVGGLVARAMNPSNEWSVFDGAKVGFIPGAIAGGVAGALTQASPLSAVVLGGVGAVAGAALGRLWAEAN